MKRIAFLIIVLLSVTSCFKLGTNVKKKNKDQDKTEIPSEINPLNNSSVLSTNITNNQLVIIGNNLTSVTNVKIQGSGINEEFDIETKNDNQIIANARNTISFIAGSILNLIISNAYASATFQITMDVTDGSITAAKLSDMGASVGQILKYNGTTWVPSDLGGLTYAGNWNASTNTPDLDGGGNSGEYYIVNTSGSYDLLGGYGTNNWNVGDWAVWNDVLAQWEKIDNASSVQSFNGRSGAVLPLPNDYTWSQINKTTSSINDITDVDTTGASNGSVLKFNGTKWIVGSDNTAGAGSVTSSDIGDGEIVNADISASAAISQSKISGLSSSLASKLDISGGTLSGNIDMGSNNIITGGTVDGVDISTLDSQVSAITATVSSNSSSISTNTSSIASNTSTIALKEDAFTAGTSMQYFRGDKTWQTLDTDNVTEGLSNKYYHASQVINDIIEIGSITDGELNKVPSSNDVFDALSLKQNNLGFTPINKAGDSVSGNISLESTKELRFNDLDNSAYIALKSPDSVASSITLTLPETAGSNGQILTTDGLGVLSWTTMSASGDITDVVAGSGLTGGASSGSATLSVDTGTGANQIVKLDSSARLPAIDGSLLTNIPNQTLSTLLSGFSVGADSSITSTDSVLNALSKTQGQINANNSDIASNFTALLGKEDSITKGDITESTSSVLTITGGSSSVIGSGVTIEVKKSDSSNNGYLSSTDWNTFNNKLGTDNVDNNTIELSSNNLQLKDLAVVESKVADRAISNTKIKNNVKLVSSNYTVLTGDINSTIIVTSGANITLPDPSSETGFKVLIKSASSTPFSILPNSSETIDDKSVISMNSKNSFIELITDGANWYIIKSSDSVSVGTIPCPTGYISVNGSATFGTDNFCVMKFEAKNLSGTPISVPNNTPWVSIDSPSAQSACESVTEVGFTGTFTLISNQEWMTIARDIESVPANWSGGSVGSGHIARGHTDNSPSSALAISTVSDPYNGTGNNAGESAGSGWEQKRIHYLSNGAVIWDFGGNVLEKVDWDKNSAGYDNAPIDATNSWKDVLTLDGSFSSNDVSPNGSYTHSQSMGQWQGGSGGGAFRGGTYSWGDKSGIYGLSTNSLSTYTAADVGFRCVYRP
ncbi:MAG: hypothetical protein H6622_13380 [Halobacteriovoraceae bacterium]|nr:hypothetical protein [Halobacteriovoraceae bacterium]